MAHVGGGMAGMIGADPDQLMQLGSTMTRQREVVEGIVSLVGSHLANTLWSGPARQTFESEWQSSFRVALTRLGEAFEMAGRDCHARANELRRVMGVG
ncbi:MAG: hypothetical protein ACO3SP_00375 [Ilumatobacteraceae bacterium]